MEAGTAARLLVTLFIFSCTTSAAETAPQAKQKTAADIVYRNGFVYTVDAVRTRAQAFAVQDGKFLIFISPARRSCARA